MAKHEIPGTTACVVTHGDAQSKPAHLWESLPDAIARLDPFQTTDARVRREYGVES